MSPATDAAGVSGPGPASADPAAPKAVLDTSLGAEPAQRVRLAQASLALLLLAASVLGLLFFAWAGLAPWVPMLRWAFFTLLGMAVFYLLIRSGWSRRLAEPSLTVPQMVFALLSAAMAYALLGPGRAAVFPVVMLILMLGMFVVSPRQMAWVGAYALALFGLTLGLMAWRQPLAYPAWVEAGHFLLLALTVPAVVLLATRLHRVRQRARQQRTELAKALSRLRENATRDELTGLINRRHMQALIEQEYQRCIRSGQVFCLAMLDIDRFKPVNEVHGYAVGDAVLRAVAEEVQRQVRVSDVLSRWGSDEMVLMMSDARAALARGGLERIVERVAALRILHGGTALNVTLTGGLAEHHAGESVAQTLERAGAALQEAKALGRGHVVVAP